MSGENNMHTLLPECFQDTEFVETNFTDSGHASPDNIFSILEALEGSSSEFNPLTPLDHETSFAQKEGEPVEAATRILVSQKSTSSLSAPLEESETEPEAADDSPETAKRQKLITATGDAENGQQQKISHITVERNRRKQMNDNLSVLRSLMPSFYVKRSDQASIVGGVVDYISELQQVLQSLGAKKQRKAYTEVLSPRLNSVSSPRTLSLSPRKPPLSPRVPPSLPISPRTPQPTNPYKLHQPAGYLAPIMVSSSHELTPPSSTSIPIGNSANNDLVANSKSSIADVEVKFCGPNVLVKTISSRIPGQATKIISTLEDLSLEVLNVSLGTIDDTMINSFTIKIGIECRLSAEELAHQIQQTFC